MKLATKPLLRPLNQDFNSDVYMNFQRYASQPIFSIYLLPACLLVFFLILTGQS